MRLACQILLRRVLLLVSIIPAVAQGQAHQPPPAKIAEYLKLSRAEFSGERARDVVAFMERWFRVPGNTGFDASIDHVASILRSAGYVREDSATSHDRLVFRIESRPLPRPTWDPIDASITIVGDRAPLQTWSTNRNMLAINSWSTPDTGVVAPLVDTGRGTPAELDSARVAGKIVVAEAGLSALYTEAVVKRGAVGALAYRMPAYTKPDVHRTSIQFTSIPYDTVRRAWGIALSKHGLDGLRSAMARGPVMLRVKTATRLFPSTNRTLVAEVRGSVRPEERFVFSAHVQEPGANDNASGVGALAEIARVLAKQTKARRIDAKRTITMLFGNEIQQTRDFLAADSARMREVHWGLSLDMVGEDTKKTGGTFLIEKMPDPSAVWTRGEEKHSEWGGSPLTKDRIVPHYFNDFLLSRCLDQAATTGWAVKTNPFEGGSDHTPFLQFKRPGVLFWHFTDVFYHTDGDRLENVSAATLSNVGNCALVSALTLATADGATARAIVGEVERAAIARLDTELALSRAAIARGGPAAKEREILETWTDYYVKTIGTMSDIEVGGSSPQTMQSITSARARVDAAGKARLANLE